MMKSTIKLILMLALAVSLLGGCKAREVIVMQDRYTPALKAEAFTKYKDVPVFFDKVSNRASDTTTFAYQDSQKKMWYVTDTMLEQYVGYALQKAFRKAGLKV